MKMVLLAFLAAAVPAAAQQTADTGYAPKLSHATFTPTGPVVAMDAAHRNFHTLAEEYAPFGRLLSADGYRVTESTVPLSAEALKGVSILVIANARLTTGPSAFTADEIAAVRTWVQHGGSLLLIADHAPFGTAAADLSAAFGVDMGQGFVAVRQGRGVTSEIDYAGRALGDHPILAGVMLDDRVRRVTSFTGQSLGVPTNATALLIIPNDGVEVETQQQVTALGKGYPASGRRVGGRAQAVALQFGNGRVVVAGEAAMFTAQRVRGADGRFTTVGLPVADDQKFALNTVHWLSHLAARQPG